MVYDEAIHRGKVLRGTQSLLLIHCP